MRVHTASVVVLAVATLGPGLAAATDWTDDKIVELARSTPDASVPAESPALRDAILHPVAPDGGRPDSFFAALAAYYDANHDGRFTSQELDAVIDAYAARYADLLRESLAKGPQQELAAQYRVKTWKMLQKMVLLRDTLKQRNEAEWRYTPAVASPANVAWDKEHTLSGAADFKERVCAASSKQPVLVKFGSTQCADCMLMEHTQGVRVAAEKGGDNFALYKLWWGPNVPEENDRVRKAEGIKSSPTFVVYRDGRRYPCGFAFVDETGAGLESCLATTLKGPASTEAPACGAGS